nr:retrovirus-related Pol polyprotein from transposon TNT 1-94 [Tanacetum cinerariifolium]
MFDEYLNPSPCVDLQVLAVITPEPAVLIGTPSLTTIDQDEPSMSTSQTTLETPSFFIPLGVKEADQDIKVAYMDNNPNVDFLIPEPSYKESSIQSYTKALTESRWIKAMQEELNEFERLDVWELVPCPYHVIIITLKWIYKVKLEELVGVLKNKARLVSRGYRHEEGIEFKEYFVELHNSRPSVYLFHSLLYEHGHLPNGCEDHVFECRTA